VLAVSGRGIVPVLIIVASLFIANCVPLGTPLAPTSTAEIQYWLTPTQYSTQELPEPSQTSIPEPSTLDLIDQAFEREEITSEQRLLYLAYAMYEYESLPNQFRGTKGWRGTLTAWELYEVANNASILCSMIPDIRSEIQRLINPHTTCETSNQTLSTPTLIDQAFAAGDITEEKRLLYLTYAFFEYESLPIQFQSNVGWRGTYILGELEKAINDPAVFCSMSPDVRSEIQRLNDPNIICN
jgi:hypothetical protein